MKSNVSILVARWLDESCQGVQRFILRTSVHWIHRGFTVNENVLHPFARFRRKHHLDDMPKIPFPRESCVRSWREPLVEGRAPLLAKKWKHEIWRGDSSSDERKRSFGIFLFSWWWWEGSAPWDLCNEPMISLITRRKRDTDIFFVLTS